MLRAERLWTGALIVAGVAASIATSPAPLPSRSGQVHLQPPDRRAEETVTIDVHGSHDEHRLSGRCSLTGVSGLDEGETVVFQVSLRSAAGEVLGSERLNIEGPLALPFAEERKKAAEAAAQADAPAPAPPPPAPQVDVETIVGCASGDCAHEITIACERLDDLDGIETEIDWRASADFVNGVSLCDSSTVTVE